MHTEPETWHHGLVARWWAEFNDDFRSHELAYVRDFVAEAGQPVLDAGCGAGRLLVPLLADGIDIDGVDASADMIDACRSKAAARGLTPQLRVQALHELDLPRRYATIIVVGTFGLGSDRARDRQALRRLRDHLEPGGRLLIDIEVPYADSWHWDQWVPERHQTLPEPPAETGERRTASDGTELAIGHRLLAVDPLEQRVTMQIVAEQFHEGALQRREERRLDITVYFPHELQLLLEQAGFHDVVLHGEHEPRPPRPDDSFVVLVARA